MIYAIVIALVLPLLLLMAPPSPTMICPLACNARRMDLTRAVEVVVVVVVLPMDTDAVFNSSESNKICMRTCEITPHFRHCAVRIT